MKFHIGVPDDEGTVALTTDYTNTGVVKFKSIPDLISGYIGDVPVPTEGEDDDEYEFGKIDDLTLTEVVLEEDVKRRVFTVVSSEDVEDIWGRMDVDETPEQRATYYMGMISEDYPKLVTEVDKFLNKIQGLIEHECTHITISNSKNTGAFMVVKKGTDYHDELIDKGIIPYSEMDNGRDYSYQHGMLEVLKFIYSTIMLDGVLSAVVTSELQKLDDSNDQSPISKVYGLRIMMIDKDTIVSDQLSAKTLLDCATRDMVTNEVCDADSRTIYCGADKNDIICGFDMV